MVKNASDSLLADLCDEHLSFQDIQNKGYVLKMLKKGIVSQVDGIRNTISMVCCRRRSLQRTLLFDNCASKKSISVYALDQARSLPVGTQKNAAPFKMRNPGNWVSLMQLSSQASNIIGPIRTILANGLSFIAVAGYWMSLAWLVGEV